MQAPVRYYAFHTLGWLQFQRLAESVLSDVFGQTVQRFEPGRDGGRDAAFFGSWTATDGAAYFGAFMFQVKFTSVPGRRLSESHLADEVAKAKELREAGLCDNYFLITNLAASADAISRLEERLRTEIGCAVRVFEASWLTQTIRESSHLRMMVPRVYGLGDLSEILDERAYTQARAILTTLGDRLQTFVPTAASNQAALSLRDHRFVLVVGDPMTGKTTISSALALGALDHLKQRVVKISRPEEFIRHWNADRNARQFFWVDDAFGQTQHDRGLTQSWSRHLESLRVAVRRGASVLMTTRSYIWKEARTELKLYQFPEFEDRKVVIQLHDLSADEKAQMLYHHVRMGRQPQEYKTQLRPLLPALVALDPFFPEAARRLGDPLFTKSLRPPTAASLGAFFENPTHMLVDMVRGLEPAQRALLAIMFAHGGALEAPFAPSERDRAVGERFGAAETTVRAALAALDGSLVRYAMDLGGRASYDYAHPTIRDAVAEITGSEPEWLDIYLAGAGIAQILRETSAGAVEAYGVKVCIPEARFDDFADRLASCRAVANRSGRFGETVEFYLAYRCSAAFLSRALVRQPTLFEENTYYEHSDSENDAFLAVAARLAEQRILPPHIRDAAAQRMREYGRRSLGFLNSDEIAPLLTEDERSDIVSAVRTDLAKNLSEIRSNLRSNYEESWGNPDDFFAEFFTYANNVLTMFADDEDVKALVEHQRRMGEDDVAELHAENAEREGVVFRPVSRDYAVATLHQREDDVAGRDVFSDVADPL
ncbi:MAG: hypothetical protein M3169_16985 [Candidatus Eremiobacteraeota bacterium]|nr:hypothetical protein [Candidatus Eremiobacteraeota bacterium]